MNEKIKKTLNFLLRFGVSAGLLWFVFSKIDLAKTIEIIKSADINFIIISGLTFFITAVILLIRWWLFIKAMDLKVTFFNVFRHHCLGLFGNSCLPSAIGGDLLKTIGMLKYTDEKPKVFASVLMDRISGFVSIVTVCTIAFIFGYQYINDITLAVPVVIMAGGLSIIILVLFNQKIYSFFCSVFNSFPKLKKGLMQMHEDIAMMKTHYSYGLWAIGMSCVSQMILAVSFYYCALALHQEINIIYFLIFVPLICVSSIVPSIGGLGVREAMSIYLYSKIGVDSGIAASLTLINYLFIIVVALLGGLIYVVTISSGRVQHHSQNTGSA